MNSFHPKNQKHHPKKWEFQTHHQKTQLKKVKNVKDVTKMQSSNVHIQIAFKWFDKFYAKFVIKIATMDLQLRTIKENG